MKKHIFLPILLFLLLHLRGNAQVQSPIELEVAHHKTSSIVFPFAIVHVDRGSPGLLAQIPPGVENILQVKAATASLPATNLTVITTDGHLYSFDVRYTASPTVTSLHLSPPSGLLHAARFPGRTLQEAQLKTISGELAAEPQCLYGIKDKAGGAKASVTGIYQQGGTLFFRLVLSNSATIPYHPDFIRFSVRDRKQPRRTARQETALRPIYTYGEPTAPLATGEQRVLVFALDRFTISPAKALLVELFEQQGDRHLQLRINARQLLNACSLRYMP